MNGSIVYASLIVGLVFGPIMIASAAWVYIKHQQFGMGGSVLTIFGTILMGLSIWQTVTVNISPEGVVVELAAKLETIENQLETQNRNLETLSASTVDSEDLNAKLEPIQTQLEAQTANLEELSTTTANLELLNRNLEALDPTEIRSLNSRLDTIQDKLDQQIRIQQEEIIPNLPRSEFQR